MSTTILGQFVEVPEGFRGEPSRRVMWAPEAAVMGEVDVAVGRLLPFANGLGVVELTLRLITLTVWTNSMERTAEDKVAEIRRRLMRAAAV